MEEKKDEKQLLESLQLIELLDRGKQLKDPFLKSRVDKALKGKPERLINYLKQHPEKIEKSKTRIFIDEKLKEEYPFYPFPSEEEEIVQLSGPLQFGYFNPMKNIFGINPVHLNLNIIVVGRARSGKSNLNLIALDKLIDMAEWFNIIIIDLKKEYRCLLPKHSNLQIITFKNLRFNPLEVPDWQDPKDHINAFAEIFCRENYILTFGKNMLISTVEYLYQQRGIYDGKKNYPTFKDLYNVINAQKGPGRVADAKAGLLSRLKAYVDYSEIFCRKSFPFNTWLENHVVIELENITNEMYSTITTLIVSLVYNYYHKMNLRGSRVRTLFVVDEAGVLFNAMRDRNIQFGDSYINSLVRRGGEFGLGFWATSQEPTTLSQAIHSNTILKFMFPLVEAQQLKTMALSMALSEEQIQFAFQLPPKGKCVARYGFFPAPFLLDVPLFDGEKEVSDKFVEEKMQDFYGSVTPKQTVSQDIATKEHIQEIPEEALAFLKHIVERPFDNFTTHRKNCRIGEYRVDKARVWLEDNGYIASEKIKTTKGRSQPSCFLVLQEKALRHLNIKQHFGKGGFKHQIYCHLIKRKLESVGWTTKIESSVNLSSKLIDVVAQKDEEVIGYEVTLHFENLQENIEKDLGSLDKLVIVVEKKEISKAESVVQQIKSNLKPKKIIEVIPINDFFT